MPNSLEEMNLKSESAPLSNSLVANLNELSSMNDFNKDYKNKSVLRTGNKNPYFFPNPGTQMPFFPNQHNPNYQYFNPYQMSAKNFYSFNMFARPPFQDKRNYLKAKKEHNMHKLWPHSTHQNSLQTATTDQVDFNLDASNEHQLDKTQANETEELPKFTNNKTPMCQIHELVKFNKVNKKTLFKNFF